MHEIRLKENIASLRKEKGITQEELAKALGVTNQAVSKWESGQCCPDIQLLPELAVYFGVSTDRILGLEIVNYREDVPAHKSGDIELAKKALGKDIPETMQVLIQCIQEQISALSAPEDAEFVKSPPSPGIERG